jgi:hypothetical protein
MLVCLSSECLIKMVLAQMFAAQRMHSVLRNPGFHTDPNELENSIFILLSEASVIYSPAFTFKKRNYLRLEVFHARKRKLREKEQ